MLGAVGTYQQNDLWKMNRKKLVFVDEIGLNGLARIKAEKRLGFHKTDVFEIFL